MTASAFSETDFTEDLKKIDIPVWVAHGDDDQIVPIGASPSGPQAAPARHAEGVSRLPTRHGHHPRRRPQRRSPRLLPGIGRLRHRPDGSAGLAKVSSGRATL